MYEHHRESLVPWSTFVVRVTRHVALALVIIGVALFAGVLGYHLIEGLPWLDALLNAAMLLGGMGPVDRLATDGGKLFASMYALFSGLVFISVTGVLLAPVAHRMLHKFHVDRV